jgi:hypothetical protein
MALYVTISVNDDKIHTYGATRIGKEKNPGTYRVCKYVKTDKPGIFKRVYLSVSVDAVKGVNKKL